MVKWHAYRTGSRKIPETHPGLLVATVPCPLSIDAAITFELVSFSVSPKTLDAKLKKESKKPPALLGGGSGPTGEALLTRLGTNVTLQVVDNVAEPVIARAPHRDTLAQLLCGLRGEEPDGMSAAYCFGSF